MNILVHHWLLAAALSVSLHFVTGGVGFAEEDHLKGYKIKDLNQVAPSANPYTLTNQFGSETCDLKKPQFFLVQSAKNGGDDPRGGLAGNFVCYKAKCTGTLPPVTDADSQFGSHQLKTKKATLVCLPVTVNPPVRPPCQATTGGFCWFLGGRGLDCDTACAAVDRTCDPATITYTGSAGTLAQCQAVLTALGYTGPPAIDFGSLDNEGCIVLDNTSAARNTLTPTTCAAISGGGPSWSRVCACQ